jgi:hypothetical protein
MERSAYHDGEESLSSSTFSMMWDYFFPGEEDERPPQFVPQDSPNETTGLLKNSRNRIITTPPEEENLIIETPDRIRRCQERMDVELDAIETKAAYNHAIRRRDESSSSSDYYVHSLRLLFLRADGFDVRKAALRLVTFFEAKLRLFGSEALARPIRLSDLDYKDILSLRSGCIQVLPDPDKAKRSVLCYYPRYHMYSKVENMVRRILLLLQGISFGLSLPVC